VPSEALSPKAKSQKIINFLDTENFFGSSSEQKTMFVFCIQVAMHLKPCKFSLIFHVCL